MESKKYVIANMRIPIEIKKGNNHEILTDYMAVTIEKCEVLPEKTIADVNNFSLLNQINEILNSTEEDNLVMETESATVINNTIEEKESPIIETEFVHKMFVSKSDLEKKSGNRSRNNTSFKNKTRNLNRYSIKNRLL